MKNFGKFLLGFQRRLSNIIRFNTRPRLMHESVATHSFYVGLYTIILSDYAVKKGIQVDIIKAVKRALLHDIEESIAGDVQKQIKHQMLEAYNKISDMVIVRILENLPSEIKENYLIEALSFKETLDKGEQDIESLIVNIADDISGVVYCKEELNLGNKYFEHILTDYIKRLKIKCVDTVFEEMCSSLERELSSGKEVLCND